MARPSPAEARPAPRVTVRHGRDGVLVEDGFLGYRPFFGIVSRGMLPVLRGAPIDWTRWSPLLDVELAAADRSPGAGVSPLVGAARRRGVLTFADSALAAQMFVEERLATRIDLSQPLELWNVREGHTASVWRLSGQDHEGAPMLLALNVSRDDVAADELASSADQLEAAAERCGPVIADVVARDRVTLPGPRDLRPLVVAQEWVRGAAELAFLPLRRGGRRLHAVTAWTTADDDPGRIVGAEGAELGDAEHVRAARQITTCLLTLAVRVDSGRVDVPRVDLDDGDWMWGPDGLRLVALSGRADTMPEADLGHYLRRAWRRPPPAPDRHTEALLLAGVEQGVEAVEAATSRLASPGTRDPQSS